MPYIDPTGEVAGSSSFPQPDMGYVEWVDSVPEAPAPTDNITLMLQEQQRLIQALQAQVAELQTK